MDGVERVHAGSREVKVRDPATLIGGGHDPLKPVYESGTGKRCGIHSERKKKQNNKNKVDTIKASWTLLELNPRRLLFRTTSRFRDWPDYSDCPFSRDPASAAVSTYAECFGVNTRRHLGGG